MGKKYWKIITGCLCLTSLIPLTSCNNAKKKDDEGKKPDPKPVDPPKPPVPPPTPPEVQKLGSIKLITDFGSLKLKVDEAYESNTIEVKCFDTKQKEMQSKYNIILTQLSQTPLNISINDNKLVVKPNNSPGSYKYQISATSLDAKIISNSKYIDIEIYKEKLLPDTLELTGPDKLELYFPSENKFDYKKIAKKDGKVISKFDDEIKTSLIIKSSSTSKQKDLFNNPLFTYIENMDNISISVSKNIDGSYQGSYILELKIELFSKPSVFCVKTISFNLISGLNYYDSENKYFYSRSDMNSDWELKNISSEYGMIESKKIKSQILNKSVTKIGNNFCSASGINNLVSIELPSSISTIGEYAFDTQEALSQAYIDQIMYIGDYAFNKCSLMKVDSTLHFKLVGVGKYSFFGCESFKGKYFDNIQIVSENAFAGTAIKEIHFGQNLMYLGADCLKDCSLLKNIYITAQKPPQLMGEIMGGSTPTDCKIHVPISAIDSYRNHPNWVIYQNILVGDITL